MALFFIYWIFYLINNFNIQGTGISKAILISAILAISYFISGIGLWKKRKYGKGTHRSRKIYQQLARSRRKIPPGPSHRI